jgi:hypothetical protein
MRGLDNCSSEELKFEGKEIKKAVAGQRNCAVSMIAHRSNLSRRIRAFMKWIEEVLTPYLE